MSNIVIYDTVSFKITSQRFALSKIVVCVYFHGPVKKKMFHKHLFLPTFSLKKRVDMTVWYDEDLERLFKKMENFDIGLYFCL